MFKLVIQDDEGKTTVVPLIRDEITIGRKEGNTIRLTERNVSRKHAKISRANGAVAIEDLGSYNGVRVNGTRISQRTVLSVSDRVQIGDYLIELKAEGVEQPVPYEDARTQPIERLDPAQLAQGMPAAGGMPIALADTDPTARAPAAHSLVIPTGYARLVVLSSNFAGREFQLTKQQMVIGRTDDNDVCIDHRSISRNHAKIHREPDTGRYTIMDLQSSNGVRVNGEDYGKVELRRGDIIDLGHVRMRFVEAGEDFVFGRDAQIVDVPTSSKKGWLFAVLGLVVIGGIVIVVMASGGSSSKKPDEIAAADTADKGGGDGSDSAAVPGDDNPVPAPGSAAEVGDGDGDGSGAAAATTGGGSRAATGPDTAGGAPAVDTAQITTLLGDARAAMADSKWADASNVARKILDLQPDHSDAQAIADTAKRELQNEIEYGKFNDAVGRKQYEKAVASFDKISNDSVYKNKARDQYDKLHDSFVADKKREAQSLARAHKCRDLRRLANDAGKVFSDAKDAVEAVKCEEQVAVRGGGDRGGGDRGGSAGGDRGGGSTGGGGSPPSGKSADELVAEAETAAKASQWARALKLAEEGLRAKPDASTRMRAVTAAVLAACNLKNESKSKTYFKQLPANRQTVVRQRCIQNGVNPQ